MTLYMLAIAFCGGIIAALVGAFEECLLAGLVMVAMCAFPEYAMIGDVVSYGLFPYIAFTGAVVATAFASKVRKHDLSGSAILTSLAKFQDVSVLLVSPRLLAKLGGPCGLALGAAPLCKQEALSSTEAQL